MKNFTLFIVAFLASFNLIAQDIYTENFDAATSVNSWTKAGDPNDEASISWSETGGESGSGALLLQGTNTDGVGGRGFIFEVINPGLDFTDVTDVQLQFDLKTDGALVGTAVHLRTNLPGLGLQETFDIQNEGLNASTFTSYSFDFSSISGGASESFTLGFVFAAGAGIDFGGSLLVDNVRLVDNSSAGGPACTADADDNIDPSTGSLNWSFKDGGASFDAFGNIGGSVVDNPYIDTNNESCKVYKVEKTIGCEGFAGIGTALISPIDFSNSTDKEVRLKVYAETEATSITVQLEREPFPDIAPEVAITQNITAIGQWEELVFDFSGHDEKTFRSFIIYVNRGEVCDGDVYFIDDIQVQMDEVTAPPPSSDIYTEAFDAATSVNSWTKAGDPNDEASISWSETGGESGSGALLLQGTNTDGVGGRGFIFEVINPGLDFTDVTDVQLQFDLKTEGPLVGTAVHLRTILPGPGLQETFDIQNEGLNASTFTSYSFDFSSISGGASESFTLGFVFAAGAGIDFGGSLLVDNVRLVDNSSAGGDTTPPVITLLGDASVNLAVGDPYTDAGATATDDTDGDITGDIVVGGDAVDTGSDATFTITYNVMDAAGNAADEVIRTVIVGTGGGGSDVTLLDFENGLAGVTVEHFETTGMIVTNPASEGINTSANVYEISYTSGNQWWGGVGYLFGAGVVDDQATVYKAKLYSTVAPTNVLFQVEVGGSNNPAGQVQTVTDVNQWVEVTFTLTGVPSGANRLLVRPDVGTQGGFKPNTGTLYIDDIVCVSCNSGGGAGGTTPNGPELVVNGGFEDGPSQTDWELLDQGGSITITDTEKRDGIYSALIVADVAGNGGAASFPVMQQPNFGQNNVSPGDVVRVTFNIKAISGDAAPVYKAALFSNRATGNGAVRHDITLPAMTGDWQTVTMDITTDASLDPSNGLGIQFQSDCGANPTCSAEVYIDNVSAFVLGDIDTERPVITLNGDNPLELEIGTPYVEPGFTATDNVDGDITGSVVVSGDVVDETVEGTYVKRYNVTDAEGNEAIEVTRIVNVGESGGGGVDVGPSLIPNGGFEDGPSQTAWEFLTNNGTIEITDTDKNGGTYSAKLVADVPGSAASNPIIQQEGFALNEVNIGDVVRVSFDVKALVTQPGADVKAALLSNRAEGAGASRYDINYTPTGGWQSVSEDITIDNLFVSANGLSIQFEAGCGGVTGCNIEMYVDNVSVSVVGDGGGGGGATEPVVAAPVPSQNQADVISMFSNAYTDVTVDTWRTGWSAATLEDVVIDGSDMKKYTALDFAGIETVANPIDATSMDFFHIDVWSPDATTFRVKLVDLGAGVEGEIAFNIAQEEWVSLDIPLDDFADPAVVTNGANLLTSRNSIQQLIISALPAATSTVFVDNVYFYKESILTPQTITFDPIADKTLGDPPFNLSATSDSGLDVTFSSTSNKVDVTSAGEVTILAAGEVTVDADQAGDATYEAAPTVSQTFCINPETPTITESNSILESSSATGNQWFFNGAEITGEIGQTLTVTGEGSYTVQVTIDGCSSAISEPFDNSSAVTQTITFDQLPDRTLGDEPFTVSATASSGLDVTFSPATSNISISGNTVTLLSAGLATINADQAGNANFTAAPTATSSFCVNPAQPVITVSDNNSETVTLNSSSAQGNQWFLNEVAIENGDEQSLSVTEEGIYTVRVTIDDCTSELSEEVALIVTGTDIAIESDLIVYPNPVTDILQIKGFKGDVNNIQLYDVSGRKQSNTFVKDGDTVKSNIANIPNGVYMLMIRGDVTIRQLRIIKN